MQCSRWRLITFEKLGTSPLLPFLAWYLGFGSLSNRNKQKLQRIIVSSFSRWIVSKFFLTSRPRRHEMWPILSPPEQSHKYASLPSNRCRRVCRSVCSRKRLDNLDFKQRTRLCCITVVRIRLYWKEYFPQDKMLSQDSHHRT